MTEQDNQAPESLADGLANWTPPWARQTPAAAAEPPADEPVDAVDDTSDEAAVDPAPPAPPVAAEMPPADDVPDAPVALPTEPPSHDPEPLPRQDMSLGEDDGDEAEPPQPAEAHTDDVDTPDADEVGETPPPADESAEPPAAVAEEEPAEPVDLRGALEAILLVVDEPVTETVLAQILEQPTEAIGATLRELADEYTEAGRGFDLRRAAGGWRLYTRTEFAPYVERYVLDGQQVRLTQAALETLAVVAYKQPVTRPRISAIRGVNCDGVIRTLLTRGLIEECGAEPDSGAHLYRTTTLFCEKLGIDSVDDLPPLAPFLPDDLPQDLTDVIDTERAQMRGGTPKPTPTDTAPQHDADVSDD